MKIFLLFLLATIGLYSLEVSVPVKGGTLKATLELPPNPNGKAILIISGSGPTDRDGNSAMLGGKNNSLKMLAEKLRDEGYASIRFDKRMIAESNNFAMDESKLVFSDFVEDTKAVLSRLKQENFKEYYIIGHSEGSLIATLLAQKSKVDGIISLCGLGKPMTQTLISQFQDRAPGLVPRVEEHLKELVETDTIEVINPNLMSVFRPSILPFLKEYLTYDPSEELAKLKIAKLIINGKHDFQVKEEDGRYLLKNSPKAEYVLIDSMNHVLKNTPIDYMQQLGSYSNPDLPLNNDLEKTILNFLKNN